MIRRILFILALLTSPAFAQSAPPPVPALPDQARSTSYSISGSTCACAVNFALYGDSTDYQNWVEVYLNNVLVNYNDPTFGWTITSPTGQLGLIPRPITDAVLTFNTAQTGTVVIVGARRPRRLSQFSENRGVAARDLNQAVTDIIAVLREMWDKENDINGRSLIGIPGDIFGTLPPANVRANQYLCFGSTGLPAMCSSAIIAPGTNTANVQSTTGSVSINTTNCGGLLNASGGFNTITLPAATGFGAGCVIKVKNNETYTGIGTARGKKLAGSWPAELFPILYPSQTVEITGNGTSWYTTRNPGRWRLPTSAELCWRQDGSDTSDGLGNGTVAGDCLAHVQTAVTTIGQQWDGSGYYSCAIGLYIGGTGILNESVSQTGQSVGCYLTVNMRGAVTWTNSQMCWTSGDGSIAVFNFNLGFTPILQCNTSNTPLTGQFYGHQVVIYDINGSFEWIPGGLNDDLVVMDAQGRATLGLTTLVVGDGNARAANSILNCSSHCSGLQISGTVAFSPNVTLGQAYALHTQSYINTSASYSGTPTVSTATTPSGSSILITNGTTIPGGTSFATGGQVCTTKC